jgi:polysaccharide biosynthesis protein PslH
VTGVAAPAKAPGEELDVRILIVASSAPLPPLDGFGLLVDHLLRELRRSHDVRAVAQVREDADLRSLDGTHVADVRLSPVARQPRMVAALTSPGAVLRSRPLTDDRRVAVLWPAVAEELASFSPDVVHVMSGRLAALAPRLAGWPTVLGAVDARHLNVTARADAATGLERVALREQARRVRRLIAAEYRRFGHVTVVTPQDRRALLDLVPDLAVTPIPNGVDTTFFRPQPSVQTRSDQVVFTGTMDYAPNVTAAHLLVEEVLPRLRTRRPQATLVLAGRRPAPSVDELARSPGVTVTGEVPDIRPWLVGSQVFAAPMTSGTGIKNKLLEAMACGLPCVASPLALQGLEVEHGRHVLVADGAEATAAAVAEVLETPALATSLGREARRYVVAEHSWAQVAASHVALFEQVISEAKAEGTGAAGGRRSAARAGGWR